MENVYFYEGDVVEYLIEEGKRETARVRRVYTDSLELVNYDQGYQLVPVERVVGTVEKMIPGSWKWKPIII